MPSKSIVDAQVVAALAELETRTSGLTGEALQAELTRFMSEQSVAAEGNVTVLWSGTNGAAVDSGNLVKYGDVANNIAVNDDSNIRILNKTVANKVLERVATLKEGIEIS